MDQDLKLRKQVNYEQLSALLEFLQGHRELAKGLVRGRRGKLHTLKQWNLCAKKLNSIKDGALKDGKGWSKYWCDWKYRVRRKALELKTAKDNNQPPPDGVTALSYMEEYILSIIGENAVESVVVNCDLLAEQDKEDNLDETNDTMDAPVNQHNDTPSRRTRGQKRRHSARRNTLDLEDTGEPSSPPDRKPRVCRKESSATDIDTDEEASEFLRLEKEKLEYSKRILESVQSIAFQITRLADVMGHIRDFLINNRVNF